LDGLRDPAVVAKKNVNIIENNYSMLQFCSESKRRKNPDAQSRGCMLQKTAHHTEHHYWAPNNTNYIRAAATAVCQPDKGMHL